MFEFSDDGLALVTTLKMAGLTTVILMLIGTPLAWYLAKMRSRFKVLVEALVALPLVLPPTVLGFYFTDCFFAAISTRKNVASGHRPTIGI